jgi:phosphatidylserine/phosphatidylglycerophosphate/cardiolipin synthase-like enzyme
VNRALRVAALLLAATCTSCATLSPAQQDRAAGIAAQARVRTLDCADPDACALASPLRELGGAAFAASTPDAPRHYALILDRGPDALLARLNLIRSARYTLDLQTFIFDEDDSAQLVLEALQAAAARGVRVRVLVDQVAALRSAETLATLASSHVNFELRVYNPVFERSRINYPMYALAAACCWRKLNQRMHGKLLLADTTIGISGGRNYQDDYYDWDPAYNFRDRDLLVAGPVARAMAANFAAFWASPRSVPAERLTDVGRRLLRTGVPARQGYRYTRPERAAAMLRAVGDASHVRAQLVAPALSVGAVQFIADLPDKHRRAAPEHVSQAHAELPATDALRALIASARTEVLLQTPYLVLSKPAQQLFRDLRQRRPAPRVLVSTNSLAATDAFIVYALSHKYKRRHLREFGFQIFEFKPFPADAPIDLAATGVALPDAAGPPRPAGDAPRSELAPGSQPGTTLPVREHRAAGYLSSHANEPVPLKRAGVRIGLHAKALVIDERVGVIGTHNFDPRGDHYNTESALVIADPVFARALAASIRGDIAPANAWTIAPRDKPPVLSGLGYSLGKVSEWLPLFDLWPWRYATSYEFVPGPGCPQPLPMTDPGFRRCYRPVGDFPEVRAGLKGLTTRIFTAFGAGLAPIL